MTITRASAQLKPSIAPESTGSIRIERTPNGTIQYWTKDEAGVWHKAAELAAHDLPDVDVAVSVSFDEPTEEYKYRYAVKSHGSSKQRIEEFGLCLESTPEAGDVYGYSFTDAFDSSNPSDWSFQNTTHSDIWSWSCFPPSGIAPGSEESRFFFRTPSQPGIVVCFAIGANKTTPDQAWDADYPVPVMYDRGVKGMTIGPVPELYDPERLSQCLLDYLPVCLEQSWLNQRVQHDLQEQIAEIRLDFATEMWNLPDAGARPSQCIQYIASLDEGEI